MNLKSATMFTIVGICYFYLVRTINTINPDVLRIQDIAQAVKLLSMIASLAPLVFLGYFYKDYIRREQVLLKYITLIAFIGFSLIVILRIRDLFMVFPRMSLFLYNFSPTLYYWFESYQIITIGSFITWMTSIAVLLFFAALYRELYRQKQFNLKIAVLLAIWGSSIAVLIRSISVMLQYYAGTIQLKNLVSSGIILTTVAVSSLGLLAILYFLYAFYKVQY
jgi:hypothetical protein